MLIYTTGNLIGPQFIINFPTKRHWRSRSRIEDVKSGLIALIQDLKRFNIYSVAIPALGCGNGGLDWLQVQPLIEQAFAEVPDVQVFLFRQPINDAYTLLHFL